MRKLGQADDAKQILDKLLQNYPDEPRVPFERGMLALDEAHLPEAEGFLRRAYNHWGATREEVPLRCPGTTWCPCRS